MKFLTITTALIGITIGISGCGGASSEDPPEIPLEDLSYEELEERYKKLARSADEVQARVHRFAERHANQPRTVIVSQGFYGTTTQVHQDNYSSLGRAIALAGGRREAKRLRKATDQAYRLGRVQFSTRFDDIVHSDERCNRGIPNLLKIAGSPFATDIEKDFLIQITAKCY